MRRDRQTVRKSSLLAPLLNGTGMQRSKLATHRALRVERLEDRHMLAAANLVINEFMATNVNTLPDYFGEYPDWIEIRNLGPSSVNLGDYSLTDNDSNLQKWSFPSMNLASGSYLVVFASAPLDSEGQVLDNYVDPGGKLHTNFKIGSDGEYLALTYEDPATQDVSVVHEYAPEFPEQYPDVSFGIASGGSVRYFDAPTPGSANGVGLLGVVADTEFSFDRGFYEASFQLEITSDTPGASIYYTTDGSAPTSGMGTLYTGALTIDHTTTLRAIATKNDYLSTNVDTQTYLFLNDIVSQSQQTALDAGYPSIWDADNGNFTADYGFDAEVVGTFDAAGNPQGDDNYGGIYADRLHDDLLAIPTISIVLDPDDLFGNGPIYDRGIYIDPRHDRNLQPERATSVEWITPDGSAEFQVDSGIQMFGGAFRSQFLTSKHSFRLVFKDEYGPSELAFPLFGPEAADQFNTVVLKATANDGYSWRSSQPSDGPATLQYARDQFGHSLQQAMGHASPHDAYAHLYINGMYWGLYYAQERPDAEFAESYLGINPDNWDGIHDDEANTGDSAAWNAALAKTAQAGSSLQNYMELQGLNLDGTPDPATAPLLDVENYIDYLIINVWGGNDDWPHNNFWAGRDRSPETTEGFQFFLWDFDGVMHINEKWSPLDTKTFDQNFVGGGGEKNVGEFHHNLQTNSEYQLAFADRVHKYFFNDGLMDPDNLISRYQEIVDLVEQVMVAESARWGDMNSPTPTPIILSDWAAERDYLLNTYLPQRSGIVMNEMREYGFYPDTDAPTFNQHGGQVAVGYDLTIAAPTGTIYYTLDGSDPRLVGGAVNPSAQTYSSTPINIAAGMTVKSRVLSGGEWSALNEADFTIAPPASAANFAITELNYNPHDANPIAGLGELDVDNDDFEFVELRNIGSEAIDLTGVEFVEVSVDGDNQGIEFVFDAQTLAPGEHVLVVKDLAAFESRYGVGLNVAGEYSGRLANGGEQITLRDAEGGLIVSFQYDDSDPWHDRSDGDGSSLEVVDVAGDYDDSLNWLASSEFAGSPGAVGAGAAFDIVVNELLAHSDGANLDMVELLNTTNDVIDLSGWYLSDSSSDLFKFQFAAGTTLGAGNYLVINESTLGFAFDGQNGESLWLVEADSLTGVPLRFADTFEFDATATDVSLGRWFSGDGLATLFPMTSLTLGAENSGPLQADVVITELHYNPADVPAAEQANISRKELEFIELTNSSAVSQDISNWSIDGIDYTFPASTTILSGESIVVVPFDPSAEPAKATAFRNVFSIAGGVRLFGAAGGKLNNSGERIKLLRPEDPLTLATGDILVDTLRYDELSPWPTSADAAGDSLNRYDATAYGNFATTWRADLPSPGAFVAAATGDFDLDDDVDGFDFLAWQRGFGKSNALRSDGDSDGDGNVDASDLAAWVATYGLSAAPVVAASPVVELAAVPLSTEPVAQSQFATSEMIGAAMAVELAEKPNQTSGEVDFEEYLPLSLSFSTSATRPSDSASGPSVSDPATTEATSAQQEESSDGSSTWEEAFDEVFASIL